MNMNGDFFLNTLETLLHEPLPGFPLQEKMEPPTRRVSILNNQHELPARESAVLVLLFPKKEQLHTVFIRRNVYDGAHSGQVSFPGGKMETFDQSHIHTALRETREEIGLAENQVRVLGMLSPLYVPPSNFNIQPVVGYSSNPNHFIPDPTEVAEVFTVPLNNLLDPVYQTKKAVRLADGNVMEVPCYIFDNKIVWGATSMILSEFNEVVERAIKQTNL